jgi:hypothetical protein
MKSNHPPSFGQGGRVIKFRRGKTASPPQPRLNPVQGLAKYQKGHEDAGDYRHRMLVNIAAFLFVIALIGAGLWLANTMAEMRRGQDCVLSGRKGCTPVEVNGNRW